MDSKRRSALFALCRTSRSPPGGRVAAARVDRLVFAVPASFTPHLLVPHRGSGAPPLRAGGGVYWPASAVAKHWPNSEVVLALRVILRVL
jgi:hypothetical protein